MTTIYTLELEHGKYYVGRSTFPKKRILAHFTTNGSEWTKLHPPVRVISQILGDEFDEEKHTLIAMNTYGVDNVRGGSYCTLTLSKFEKEKAQQTIWSIMDKCYKCGNVGHFAKNCADSSGSPKCGYVRDPEQHLAYNVNGTRPLGGWDNYPNELYLGTNALLAAKQNNDKCPACNGSGRCYWAAGDDGEDDMYGSCFECCCVNCGQKSCRCFECKCCLDIIANELNNNNCCHACTLSMCKICEGTGIDHFPDGRECCCNACNTFNIKCDGCTYCVH
jgi:hypothetical protein